MLEPLQVAADQLPTAYDIAIGPVRLNYPWGDDLTGEAFAGAFAYVGRRLADAWEAIGQERALWGADD